MKYLIVESYSENDDIIHEPTDDIRQAIDVAKQYSNEHNCPLTIIWIDDEEEEEYEVFGKVITNLVCVVSGNSVLSFVKEEELIEKIENPIPTAGFMGGFFPAVMDIEEEVEEEVEEEPTNPLSKYERNQANVRWIYIPKRAGSLAIVKENQSKITRDFRGAEIPDYSHNDEFMIYRYTQLTEVELYPRTDGSYNEFGKDIKLHVGGNITKENVIVGKCLVNKGKVQLNILTKDLELSLYLFNIRYIFEKVYKRMPLAKSIDLTNS